MPSHPHCYAVLLLCPLFRELCWPSHSFCPCRVFFHSLGSWHSVCRVLLRSCDEELMGERSRAGEENREKGVQGCLVFQQLYLRWIWQIVTDCDASSWHLGTSWGPQICEVGMGLEWMVGSRQGRVVLVVFLTDVECPRCLLSQWSPPFLVLWHRVASSHKVAGYNFYVLAAKISSV